MRIVVIILCVATAIMYAAIIGDMLGNGAYTEALRYYTEAR